MAKLAARRGTGSGRGDYRYLTQPRGDGTAWYAVTEVPRTLRTVLKKKRLVRSLKTADINVARAARWKALDALKAEIARAQIPQTAAEDPVRQEALALREDFTRANDSERDGLMFYIEDRAQQIDHAERGNRDLTSIEEQELDVPSQKASDYFKLATGNAYPATCTHVSFMPKPRATCTGAKAQPRPDEVV